MAELGIVLTAQDLADMMAEADINQDGKIDYKGQALAPPSLLLSFSSLPSLLSRRVQAIAEERHGAFCRPGERLCECLPT